MSCCVNVASVTDQLLGSGRPCSRVRHETHVSLQSGPAGPHTFNRESLHTEAEELVVPAGTFIGNEDAHPHQSRGCSSAVATLKLSSSSVSFR